MKVANASDVLLKPRVREELGKTIASGQEVVVTADQSDWIHALTHNDELRRMITEGKLSVGAVQVKPESHLSQALRGTGAVGGAVTGAGVGALIDCIRGLHGTTAAVLDAACAIIGAGVGGTAGAGVGFLIESGEFKNFRIEPAIEVKGVKASCKIGGALREA